MKLYQFGEIDDDWIKAQSGPLKLRRQAAETELEGLMAQKLTMNSLGHLEQQLGEYCQRMLQGF